MRQNEKAPLVVFHEFNFLSTSKETNNSLNNTANIFQQGPLQKEIPKL